MVLFCFLILYTRCDLFDPIDLDKISEPETQKSLAQYVPPAGEEPLSQAASELPAPIMSDLPTSSEPSLPAISDPILLPAEAASVNSCKTDALSMSDTAHVMSDANLAIQDPLAGKTEACDVHSDSSCSTASAVNPEPEIYQNALKKSQNG